MRLLFLLLGLATLWLILGRSSSPVTLAPARPATFGPQAAATPLLAPDPPAVLRSGVEEPGAKEPAARATVGGVRVEGRVTDEDGRPVGDAVVTVLLAIDRPLEVLGHTTTHADGTYAFALRRFGAPQGFERDAAEVHVDVRAPRGIGESGELWSARERGVLKLDVELESETAILVQAVDGAGRPVEGAHAELERETRAGWKLVDWEGSDRLGRITFALDDELEPGEYRIRVVDAGHGRATISVVGLLPREVRDLGPLVLVPRGTLSGRVVDASGAPVPGHEVCADRVEPDGSEYEWTDEDGHATWTDARGRFHFADLPQGAWQLTAAHQRARETLVPTGSNGILVIVDTPTLSVRFVDADGRAVRGVSLHVDSRLGEALRGPYEDEPAPASEHEARDGTWHVAFEQPGPYALSAQHVTANHLWLAHAYVWPTRGHDELTLQLVPNERAHARLSLEIVDAAGRTVPEWSAELRTVETGVVVEALRAGGELALPAGEYRLLVTPDPKSFVPPFERKVDVPPGELTLRVAASREGGLVKLRVSGPKDADRRLHFRAWLLPEGTQAGLPRRFSFASGCVRGTAVVLSTGSDYTTYGALVPGRYRLELRGRSIVSLTRRLDIVAGETTELTLDLVGRAASRAQ